jgi:hypothetical protein
MIILVIMLDPTFDYGALFWGKLIDLNRPFADNEREE